MIDAPVLRPVPVSEIADPVGLLRSAGILMSETAERLDAIERAKWVLVVMDQGEHWRCRACGGKHRYQHYGAVFTRHCVPRPWRGIRQGLTAYFENLGAQNWADLSPEQVRRLRTVAPRIGRADALPALAAHHPQMAQQLGTPASDVDYVGLLLGNLVEIDEADARRFANLINGRARRVIVPL